MQTVLYVYESQNNNGWKWCAVQTDERVGEIQRLAREKESPRINNKPAAVSVGVSATSRLGIDLDRVEFRRPPEFQAAAARSTVYIDVSQAVRESAMTTALDENRRLTNELAEIKTELAAARGVVRGLENDRDNWHAEAKRLREERKALKVALLSFGL